MYKIVVSNAVPRKAESSSGVVGCVMKVRIIRTIATNIIFGMVTRFVIIRRAVNISKAPIACGEGCNCI